MYKNIIVPIDIDSKNSWDLAIAAVNEIAARFDSIVHFVNIVPDFGLGMVQQYFPKGWIKDITKKSEIELKNIIDKSSLNKNISYDITVMRGAVYQMIIDFAEKTEADLIIMAAHHPNRSDLLLGSNTVKVARHTKLSILIVRD